MDLAPAQVGTDVPNASTMSDKHYTALLNDSIFKGIHDAFLMGSSLVELKGRVQVAACNSSLDTITFDSSTSTFVASVGGPSPSTANTPKQQPNVIDSVLKNIVLKDVAQSLSAELRDHAWLTSVFRAIFKQIVMLHIDRFPYSTTTNSIYDLPTPPKNPQDLSSYPYPYLYPDSLDPENLNPFSHFDYANVGIGSKDASSGNDTASFVANFKLYDVTRRALNCLTLLLDEAEESLVPEITECYQRRLVQAILADPRIPSPEPDCTKIPKLLPDDIQKAVKTLGNQVVRLLEAWDSFLHECFYSDMGTKSNDPNALVRDNKIELAAYEAGRSLTALSWNVSVATMPLENALKPDQEMDAKIKKTLTIKAQTTWQQVFNDRDINHIQYQITALCTALDRAYYRVNPDIKPPGANDSLMPLNPELPSQAIQAVKHSLNYWERTVARLCSPDVIMIKPALDPSSVAAPTPNSSANDTLSPTVLDWELAKTLRTELIQQAIIWQSLILCQQDLRSFSIDKVTQRILNDFMKDLEQAMKDEILKNRTVRRASTVIIAVIFAIIVLIIAGAVKYQNFSLSGIIQSPVVIITAIGALLTPFVTSISSRLSKLGTFFGTAGTAMEQALQRGYTQMLIEFDYLNHNVAVTFPLIEFFIWDELKVLVENPNGEKVVTTIQDGYDFLVNVFWSKADFEEEFQRVARAAFGPISAFIGAQLGVTTPTAKGPRKTSKPSTKQIENGKQ